MMLHLITRCGLGCSVGGSRLSHFCTSKRPFYYAHYNICPSLSGDRFHIPPLLPPQATATVSLGTCMSASLPPSLSSSAPPPLRQGFPSSPGWSRICYVHQASLQRAEICLLLLPEHRATASSCLRFPWARPYHQWVVGLNN